MRSLALHARHAQLGAVFFELDGRELVLHYRSPEAEDAALRTGAALVDLSGRDVLRITGPDRLTFLHGMVSQDVTGMPERGVRYAALLTAKGAMVSDARVVRRAEDVLLLLEPGAGPAVAAHLERFLISEEAEIHDASDAFGQLGILGPRGGDLAVELLGLPGGSVDVWDLVPAFPEVLALPSGLLLPGLDLLVPAGALPSVFERLLTAVASGRIVPAGWSALEVLRVERGIPRFGADMDEKTIPLEANLDRALHFQKGCYIGQEVIARATFRGHMNRTLVGLRLGPDAAARGAELFAEARKVGTLTSVVRSPRLQEWIGLGTVHRNFAAPGTLLRVGSGGTASVGPLPFPAPGP